MGCLESPDCVLSEGGKRWECWETGLSLRQKKVLQMERRAQEREEKERDREKEREIERERK